MLMNFSRKLRYFSILDNMQYNTSALSTITVVSEEEKQTVHSDTEVTICDRI